MSLTQGLSHENSQFQDTAEKQPGSDAAETSPLYLKVALNPQGRDPPNCCYGASYQRSQIRISHKCDGLEKTAE